MTAFAHASLTANATSARRSASRPARRPREPIAERIRATSSEQARAVIAMAGASLDVRANGARCEDVMRLLPAV
jgi:hypothetical protein